MLLRKNYGLVIIAGLFFINLSSCEDPLPQNIQDDIRYVSYQELKNDIEEFTEVTSFSEMLFDTEGKYVFVGARDNIHRLSSDKLKQLNRESWIPSNASMNTCMIKGKSEKDCHNYVKILQSDGKRLFVCGTYAFSPICSWRKLDNLEIEKFMAGDSKCPVNPKANITSLLKPTGEFYVGTATDFSESDSGIHRFKTLEERPEYMRTNKFIEKGLNEPQFVGSFEDDKFVYFVFREITLEYSSFGKMIHSRIARICKNDMGQSGKTEKIWSTFVKARLSCSVQGDYPFFYDEIQGMQYIPETKVLYAAFTTSPNSIAGSAICAFNISAINEAFLGSFKYNLPRTSCWESRNEKDFNYHVGCGSGSVDRSDLYQIMDSEIQPTTTKPLHTAVLERYSQITVAPVTDFSQMHLLFVVNDAGVIKKLSFSPKTNTICLIEIWKPVLENIQSPIKTMRYLDYTKSLYIGTVSTVIKIAIARCHRFDARASCLGAQDPLCGWIERTKKCEQVALNERDQFEQNTPACPDTNILLDGGWSEWSEWSDCSQVNGSHLYDNDGQDSCRCQSRQCNKPVPRNGGKGCQGVVINVANCTVHGGWTEWSSVSPCSATCGVAYQLKKRTCEAPRPANGGRLCVGDDHMVEYCTQNPQCPTPPPERKWSAWSTWSPCSSTCGNGTKWRTRSCDSLLYCSGCGTEIGFCYNPQCKTMQTSKMTPWQKMSFERSNDGNYIEKRYEIACSVQATGLIELNISKEEERYCNSTESCSLTPLQKLDEGSEWGPWSTCSADCGGGYQTSTKKCLQSQCQESETVRQQVCNTHSCIDGWGCWSDWSLCSESCDTERSERQRTCVTTSCKGDSVEYRNCPPCEPGGFNPELFVCICLVVGIIIGLIILFIKKRYVKKKRSASAPTHVSAQTNIYAEAPLIEDSNKYHASISGADDFALSKLNKNKINNDSNIGCDFKSLS